MKKPRVGPYNSSALEIFAPFLHKFGKYITFFHFTQYVAPLTDTTLPISQPGPKKLNNYLSIRYTLIRKVFEILVWLQLCTCIFFFLQMQRLQWPRYCICCFQKHFGNRRNWSDCYAGYTPFQISVYSHAIHLFIVTT